VLADVALKGLDPRIGQEIHQLNSQVDSLVKNVSAVEQNWKPVAQSANKLVRTLESYPQEVQNFKARYQIPQNPTLQQEVEGAGRFLREKLHVSPEQASRTSAAIKSSPIYEQLKAPFQPANIMMAVGATAGINVLAQLGSEGGVDLGKAMGFVGESSFWGGMVGSGVGYGLMAAVATSLFPGGAGLVGVLTPVFAGMTGSIFGFEVGSNLTKGESLSTILKGLSPATILGQAGGSTVGLLVGSQIGVMLGGTLGAVAGPLGAMAGAVLLGQVGAKVGEAVKALFQGDEQPMNDALQGAAAVLAKLDKAQSALGKAESAIGQLIPPSLPAASIAVEGLPARLKGEYNQTYTDLAASLKKGDRARAYLQIQYLQKLQGRYNLAVGQSLQKLSQE
jgi:hypothetical protein